MTPTARSWVYKLTNSYAPNATGCIACTKHVCMAPKILHWCICMQCSIKEDHQQPIYCVCFNFLSASCANVFASCGGDRVRSACDALCNLMHVTWACLRWCLLLTSFCMPHIQATIYRCLPGGAIEILQAYVDDDVRSSTPLLCLLAAACRPGAWLYLKRERISRSNQIYV